MAPKVTDFLRFSGAVKRYHTWPVLRADTVAEHCWNVLRIYITVFGPPPAHVTTYIVHHDSPELLTGDPPFPIKRDNPELKRVYDRLDDEFNADHGVGGEELKPDDRIRIKVCDLIDMWEFGLIECAMGNTFAERIVTRTEENALRMATALTEREYETIRKYMTSTREKLK